MKTPQGRLAAPSAPAFLGPQHPPGTPGSAPHFWILPTMCPQESLSRAKPNVGLTMALPAYTKGAAEEGPTHTPSTDPRLVMVAWVHEASP